MKVIAIYPGLNPLVNDIAGALAYLVQQGHQVQVITARANPSKSTYDEDVYEVKAGLYIHRPFARFLPDMIYRPLPALQSLQSLMAQFKPDILLCSHEHTIRVGLMIKEMLGLDVPIVVVSEFAGKLADRGYAGIVANLTFPWLGLPRGKRYWPWLCRQTEAIITCYPGDLDRLDELSHQGAKVFFVPWCNELPANFQPSEGRDQELGIYIGAFSPWKNTDAFLKLAPAILEHTPTRHFVFVGQGEIRVLNRLKKRFGQVIEHIPGLPRQQALQLLSTAYYGLTPAKKGGWGFIGDCWAVKTPIVTLANDYKLNHEQDAIVGGSLSGIIAGINKLYTQPNLYHNLQITGYNRYNQHHTARAVGSTYEAILTKVVADQGKINNANNK